VKLLGISRNHCKFTVTYICCGKVCVKWNSYQPGVTFLIGNHVG